MKYQRIDIQAVDLKLWKYTLDQENFKFDLIFYHVFQKNVQWFINDQKK